MFFVRKDLEVAFLGSAFLLLGPLRQTRDDFIVGRSMDGLSSSSSGIALDANPNGRYVSLGALIQMMSAIRMADSGMGNGSSPPLQSEKLANASIPTRMTILKYLEVDTPKSIENLKSLKGGRIVKLSTSISEQIDFTTDPVTTILLSPMSRGTEAREFDSNELMSPTPTTILSGPNDTSNFSRLIKFLK